MEDSTDCKAKQISLEKQVAQKVLLFRLDSATMALWIRRCSSEPKIASSDLLRYFSDILRFAPHARCPGGTIPLRIARATHIVGARCTAGCSEALAHVV